MSPLPDSKSPAQTSAATTTTKAAPKSAGATDEAAAEAAEGKASPGFVDRDGDGIQDGQEHRFRRKRGTLRQGGAGAGEQVRQRYGKTSEGGGPGGPGKENGGPGPGGR